MTNELKVLRAEYDSALNAGNLELAGSLASEIMAVEDASK